MKSRSTELRRFPQGAEATADGTSFRIWAPSCEQVEIVLATTEGNPVNSFVMEREEEGYFSRTLADVHTGLRYWFRLNDESQLYADPVSRYQPSGPHGPSQVVDASTFPWTDHEWPGIAPEQAVVYEMHIGTFTPEGTWTAAQTQLAELAELGVTVIEMMPVAEFPGEFGWGYDGVLLFAPSHLYGTPDDLRAFIDTAHRFGIAVILDVVYNHLGPDGNYLPKFAAEFFSNTHTTDWGSGLNFDGPQCGPVRAFVEMNARYWIEEFHFDGLRLDATQDIKDDSEFHIVRTLTESAREVARQRRLLIVGENEPQKVRFVRPTEQGGYGIDALWNDDFHHAAMVSLLGRNEAYYTDYLGKPQEFISSVKRGFLYQGQMYKWQQKRRGTPSLKINPRQLFNFLQNHDQIANSSRGLRCHALSNPGHFKALTALMLLAPQIPMLFQGQEFAASSPFYYFADHRPELAELVHAGRKEFLAQFPSISSPEVQEELPHPAERHTFLRSKLNFEERTRHAEIYQLHRDLLKIRRENPLFHAASPGSIDGAVLGDEAFVLRYFSPDEDDRLLIVNLSRNLHFSPAPEPLLAPPWGKLSWEVEWSSEDLLYGGTGTPPVDTFEGWRIPGYSALLMRGSIEPTLPPVE